MRIFCNAEAPCSIPGSGKSTGEGIGYPLQHSWTYLVAQMIKKKKKRICLQCRRPEFSPWGRCESDTTERLHFHFSLSCIGEGNGNLLQCSCLENPRDGGAWWAAIYGITQSRTRLKRLSSSSSSSSYCHGYCK